jgi:hypothetical protein
MDAVTYTPRPQLNGADSFHLYGDLRRRDLNRRVNVGINAVTMPGGAKRAANRHENTVIHGTCTRPSIE